MGARKYRNITDEMWRAYLETQGTPLQDWFACDGLYGRKASDGQLLIVMDDDGERASEIEAYLRRLGQERSRDQLDG